MAAQQTIIVEEIFLYYQYIVNLFLFWENLKISSQKGLFFWGCINSKKLISCMAHWSFWEPRSETAEATYQIVDWNLVET